MTTETDLKLGAPCTSTTLPRTAPTHVSHGRWLAERTPSAELWLRPEDGHISVLHSAAAALGWLREHT